MTRTRRVAFISGVALAGAVAGGAMSTVWAAESGAGVPEPGVHSVYCQTPQFDSYVRFNTPGTMTPGGGPVCYAGTGTAPIDLHGVTRFSSGAHSGSFQYRNQPGLPIVLRSFTPDQSQQFDPSVEVVSLTITS